MVSFTERPVTVNCPIYDRAKLRAGQRIAGPLIVEEWTSTTLVLPGQMLEIDAYGNLIITVEGTHDR
jgi:N-methylhydantoinase A